MVALGLPPSPVAAESPGRRRAPAPPIAIAPAASAKAAGLRYVPDTAAGLRRLNAGSGFRYVDAMGAPVRDKATLARIRTLAIPPAWTDVWISPREDGHIQATGRDARGRKQYRYHARWGEERNANKYGRMIAFGEALPGIRGATDAHLRKQGLPREKVLATVLRLLESTLIRVGNAEYARDNESFGLTTMRDEHADVNGSHMRFTFRGKSGKDHEVGLRDTRLARIVQRCQDVPGEDLFQYLDEEGAPQSIGSGDVNAYLREISHDDFSAKDFRTWAGTVLALEALAAAGAPETATEAKRQVVAAVASVAAQLGNTPSVCRKCYVHPAVIDAFTGGLPLAELVEHAGAAGGYPGLTPPEVATLALLRERAAT